MKTILMWVLVVAASTNQNSPIISPPVTDLGSCQRLSAAINADSPRVTRCVQISVLVPTK